MVHQHNEKIGMFHSYLSLPEGNLDKFEDDFPLSVGIIFVISE